MSTKPATPAKTPTDAAFNRAVKACLASAGAVNKAGWIIGDNATKVATVYKEASKLQDFADAINLPYKTVMDYRRVAAAWPASDRSDTVSWTVHQILMQLSDKAKLIKREDGWSTAQARAYVKSLATGDGTGGNGDEIESDEIGPSAPPAPEMTPLEKARANVARLQSELSNALLKLAQLEAEEAAEEAAPAKTAPAKSAPAKTAPAKTAPAKTAPAKTAPAKSAPAKSAPVVHAFPKVPSHNTDNPRTDCPQCQRDGIKAMPATTTPRNARNRAA